MKTEGSVKDFASVVQRFFGDYLMEQRNASPRTIASYRDTFRVLLQYLQTRTRRPVSELDFSDIDAEAILAFLAWLEKHRSNSIRTRNVRLAAIRSFAQYAATQEPSFLPAARHIRLIPLKRFERPLLGFLSREELQAIVDAPDPASWSGRRDRALFTTLYNTGARVSEIIAARPRDLRLEGGTSLTLHGKGRKERVVPLWKRSGRLLKEWLKETGAEGDAALFPGRSGAPLSRSNVEDRLRRAVKKARSRCPSLAGRSITPHTFRHTTAMHMLQSGVDITVIALWLGHESCSTTHQYIEADLAMKRDALERIAPLPRRSRAEPAPQKLLDFLRAL